MTRSKVKNEFSVDTCFILSIFSLRKKGYLIDGKIGYLSWVNCHGSEALTISFEINQHDASWSELSILLKYSLTSLSSSDNNRMEYAISIQSTKCNFGGKRYWFLCPTWGCGTRAACLYLPQNGVKFACRKCHDLTYESSRESHSYLHKFVEQNGMTMKQFKLHQDIQRQPTPEKKKQYSRLYIIPKKKRWS